MRMKIASRGLRGLGLALALSAMSPAGHAAAAPFGGPDSVAFANKLWAALQQAHLVGPARTTSRPYKGQHPHGAVLDTIDTRLSVAGRTGIAIIKNNYGGPGVSVGAVANDPDKWLKIVTVMFKREAGYDPEDRDWFWAKFKADGQIMKNPKGALLVGRVAKGKPAGCIACHGGAPGGDLVFNHDRYAK